MNVIRMIKLFGWEPKVADQLAGKREEELKYIWKYKVLELINGNVKYVPVTIFLPVLSSVCVQLCHPHRHHGRHIRYLREFRIVCRIFVANRVNVDRLYGPRTHR